MKRPEVEKENIGNRLEGLLINYRHTFPSRINDNSTNALMQLLKELVERVISDNYIMEKKIIDKFEQIQSAFNINKMILDEITKENNKVMEEMKFMKQKKIKKVMDEFSKGDLHSGSKKGPVVTNPKQAVAIAYSEAKNKSKPRSKKGK